MIKSLGLSLLCAGVLLAGCTKDEQASTENAASAPQQEATAWWKTEGTGAATAAAATGPVVAKPGWAKLAAIDTGAVAHGKQLFDSKGCVSCHSIGKGAVVGPDLKGVTGRVEPEWLESWLKDPTPVLEKDDYAKGMLTKYLVKMPNLNLSDDEIKALRDFLREADAAKVAQK